MGRPQVAYRETIARERGRGGQVHPPERGPRAVRACRDPDGPDDWGGVIFEDATIGGVVPREFIPSVERGARESLARGVMAGYPVIDAR